MRTAVPRSRLAALAVCFAATVACVGTGVPQPAAPKRPLFSAQLVDGQREWELTPQSWGGEERILVKEDLTIEVATESLEIPPHYSTLTLSRAARSYRASWDVLDSDEDVWFSFTGDRLPQLRVRVSYVDWEDPLSKKLKLTNPVRVEILVDEVASGGSLRYGEAVFDAILVPQWEMSRGTEVDAE